jgi:hypothetical protein
MKNKVRSLMVSPSLALEHKWPLLAEETTPDFARALLLTTNDVFPEVGMECVKYVELEDYLELLKRHYVPSFKMAGKPT